MTTTLAAELMEDFAVATGIVGGAPPRRYLWTDAFAVCNFLGLYQQSGNARYLTLAKDLVQQVHHTLGRHREDDRRQGWISGLPASEGEQHPTAGGLRIGKRLPERQPTEPLDHRLEWDRDGQYYHYLTRWMHCLCRTAAVTQERCYLTWAGELAAAAHRAFRRELFHGGPLWIVWKLSIDLTRPLVASAGQHDPLDGLITALEIQAAQRSFQLVPADLTPAICELEKMCAVSHWTTADPLGIGGLLEAAARLTAVVSLQGKYRELLLRLLVETRQSLEAFASESTMHLPSTHRLAFRELGLSIGLYGLAFLEQRLADHGELQALARELQEFAPLREQIHEFWLTPAHRQSQTWRDHRDINAVMLATSLQPEGYFGAVAPAATARV